MQKNTLRTWHATLLGAAIVSLALTACGSNDSGGKDDGGTGANAGTTGNTSGTNGGGGTSGNTSTGNAGNSADSGMQMMLTCDTTVTSVTSCGSETCTPPDGMAAMYCQVSCCTADNKCGSKNTSSQAAGSPLADCSLPPMEDPRCAGKGGQASMFGTACCTSDGNCGISLQGSQCFDPSRFTGGTPVKCDEAGDDAGTN
jgi:hypothetical protein